MVLGVLRSRNKGRLVCSRTGFDGKGTGNDPLALQFPEFSSGKNDEDERQGFDQDSMAVEHIRNGRREFVVKEGSLQVVEKQRKRTLQTKAWDRLMRYFLPVGYPASVGPDYKEYTLWRLCAFFWGGCVGVFSTQGLLLAVGVGRQSSAPLAAALQWVIRDGVGRAGRMLFSQIGTGFDAETKQHRLAAAWVLNMSCTLESISPLFSNFFLPIACVANLAKGASTIAAASTRGAIYKSFMRWENLGDITAKQETVGVAGDLAGTALGILLSRLTSQNIYSSCIAFSTVSLLHLYAVYREVKGLQLSTLNRQRSHMLINAYINAAEVPTVLDLNRKERVLFKPWLDSLHRPNIDLAARLHDCAPDAEALVYLIRLYKEEKYILTYERERIRVVLRRDASSRDCLKAFYQAGEFWKEYEKRGDRERRNRDLVEESYRLTNQQFGGFIKDAERHGWRTDSVLLRPVGRRVVWGDAMNK